MAILILGVGGLVSWSDTRVACSTKSGEPAYKTLKNIHNEWDDTVELASSSSRMSLPPQIARLQEVKRKLKTQEWRDCAVTVHSPSNYQREIKGFSYFAGGGE